MKAAVAALVMTVPWLLSCGGGPSDVAASRASPERGDKRAGEPVEVKVVLADAGIVGALGPLGAASAMDVTFYLVAPPTDAGDELVVRTRTGRAEDLVVKWRGGRGRRPSGIDGLACERDAWLDDDGDVACTVEREVDAVPVAPADVARALSPGQRALVDAYGNEHSDAARMTLVPCPTVHAQVRRAKRKNLPADFMPGCTAVAFEVWTFDDGSVVHELSCKGPDLATARAALASVIEGVARAPLQVAKTAHALARCPRATAPSPPPQ